MATGNLLFDPTDMKTVRRDWQEDLRKCVGRVGCWLWTRFYQPVLERTRQRCEFGRVNHKT